MSVSKMIMGQAANLYEDPVNVENVFSTYLYDGTGSNQTITNGADLSSEGGLTWIKARESASFNDHFLFDTENGVNYFLRSNLTNAVATSANTLTAFNTNGFSLGSNSRTNQSGIDYVSWTFRKAPKFFDIVTYTGDGNADRQINHNLGSVPGMMIVKKYAGSTTRWAVYHRSLGTGKFLNLDDTASTVTQNDHWQTAPNATQFTVETNGNVNNSGDSYVAYLFAHHDGDGDFGLTNDQDIIKCGSYTTDSSGNAVVDLGFEPQFVITKGDNYISNWQIHDVMRGATVGGNAQTLRANNTDQEVSQSLKLEPNPTGFTTSQGVNGYNGIYMAIRRGPMATPTSATDVFAIDGETDTSPTPPSYNSGFPVDLFLGRRNVSGADSWYVFDRHRGNTQGLITNTTDAEQTLGGSVYALDRNDGVGSYTGTVYPNAYAWMWKRAPGYFDVVTYTGTGSSQSINHNLGVAPEMMWVKNRSSAANWSVYHKDLSSSGILRLNQTVANQTGDGPHIFGNGSTLVAPTDTVFTVGGADSTSNTSGSNYIIYLFASLAGISKVGSFTGTAATQTIDCGFSSGARFVLIKETNTTGGWMVFDTVRGIVSGNDARLELDDTGAESTASDILDPHSSGFQLPSSSFVNASGRECIFYAIA